MTAFEKRLCSELTDRTGHRFPVREVLAWSLSRTWLETIKSPDEEVVFLPELEIWVLVRPPQKTRSAA